MIQETKVLLCLSNFFSVFNPMCIDHIKLSFCVSYYHTVMYTVKFSMYLSGI